MAITFDTSIFEENEEIKAITQMFNHMGLNIGFHMMDGRQLACQLTSLQKGFFCDVRIFTHTELAENISVETNRASPLVLKNNVTDAIVDLSTRFKNMRGQNQYLTITKIINPKLLATEAWQYNHENSTEPTLSGTILRLTTEPLQVGTNIFDHFHPGTVIHNDFAPPA